MIFSSTALLSIQSRYYFARVDNDENSRPAAFSPMTVKADMRPTCITSADAHRQALSDPSHRVGMLCQFTRNNF